jgi:hypothetical protein
MGRSAVFWVRPSLEQVALDFIGQGGVGHYQGLKIAIAYCFRMEACLELILASQSVQILIFNPWSLIEILRSLRKKQNKCLVKHPIGVTTDVWLIISIKQSLVGQWQTLAADAVCGVHTWHLFSKWR